jgi:hypothetical protein
MSTERPIPFSAPMVRAILAGTKTQTRRVVKGWPLELLSTPANFTPEYVAHPENKACPYGRPGDRLWVRETHMDLGACYIYRADPGAEKERALVAPGQRWKPAIHMPRAASRITLEVTGVRVERLQAISEADALAEGIVETCGGYGLPAGEHYHAADPRQSYFSLWEAINGPGSVEANPWLWCVEFRRVTP